MKNHLEYDLIHKQINPNTIRIRICVEKHLVLVNLTLNSMFMLRIIGLNFDYTPLCNLLVTYNFRNS